MVRTLSILIAGTILLFSARASVEQVRQAGNGEPLPEEKACADLANGRTSTFFRQHLS